MIIRRGTLTTLAAGLLTLCSLAACSAGSPAAAPGTVGVVATTTQLGDFARTVGGDKVSVTQILQPNVDPHDYEATPADITAVSNAKVVLRNGVGLDKWLDATVTAAGYSGPVVDTSKGVGIHTGNGDVEEADGDPHIWQNPLNAKIMVDNIATALVGADNANATYYQANAAAYKQRLDQLDADITAEINTVPPAQRKLVTNHDAFGYYVERYHLEFVGSIIPSFDTSAELSGTQIQDLVAKIKQTGVKAIFSESSLPPKTAETIAEQAGVTVEAGEDSLYADTLGPAGSAGETYIGAMEHNTAVIVKALGGSVEHPDAARAALVLDDVTVADEWGPVLEGVRGRVEPGEAVALVGPNGGGKSTLIRAVLGLVPLLHGTITVLGRRPDQARLEVAYVPQADTLDPQFPVSVAHVVLMGRYRRIGWLRRPQRSDRLAALDALDRVGLADRAGDRFGTLSGGQRQRVLVARALVQRPRLLLLDEPFNGVDAVSQAAMLSALRLERDGGAAVVVSTHDLSIAHLTCDQACLLNRHQYAFGPVAEVLTQQGLQAAYRDSVGAFTRPPIVAPVAHRTEVA